MHYLVVFLTKTQAKGRTVHKIGGVTMPGRCVLVSGDEGGYLRSGGFTRPRGFLDKTLIAARAIIQYVHCLCLRQQ